MEKDQSLEEKLAIAMFKDPKYWLTGGVWERRKKTKQKTNYGSVNTKGNFY